MERMCAGCGKPFEAKRSTAKYCGGTCRERAASKRKGVPAEPVVEAPEVVTRLGEVAPLVSAVRRELEEGDRLETALGQQAMSLAQQIVSGYHTGTAVAALSKELRAVMAEALRDAAGSDDLVDEVRAARDRKLRAIG